MPPRVRAFIIWDEAAAMAEDLSNRLAREGSADAREVRALATRYRMRGLLDSRREVSSEPTPVGTIGPDDDTPIPVADPAAMEGAVPGQPPEATAAGASDAFWLDSDDPTGPFG